MSKQLPEGYISLQVSVNGCQFQAKGEREEIISLFLQWLRLVSPVSVKVVTQ